MTSGVQEDAVNDDLKWLKVKLANKKMSKHPGTSVNLSPKHVERLVDYIEDLEFMRGIAGDVVAHFRSSVPVPWWMRRAFADAVAFEHDKQSSQRRETDEGLQDE
jgi:hypothetical protein